MYVVFGLLLFSMFIRRFIPARGFLLDKEIEALTAFGETRQITLRNLEGVNLGDMVKISDTPVTPISQPVQQAVYAADDGVDIEDIKGKTYKEVDTDYMYSNMDSSDESLASALRKGGLR